jgi:hypothetical protein
VKVTEHTSTNQYDGDGNVTETWDAAGNHTVNSSYGQKTRTDVCSRKGAVSEPYAGENLGRAGCSEIVSWLAWHMEFADARSLSGWAARGLVGSQAACR